MDKRLNALLYLGFFTIGFVSTLTGSMLPTIRGEIHMSYGQAGLLLTGMLPGIIVSMLLGGYLSNKYGTKALLMMGGTALTFGLLGSMAARDYFSLIFWMVVSGLGFGAYEIGINVLCSVSNNFKIGKALNFLHFFFG